MKRWINLLCLGAVVISSASCLKSGDNYTCNLNRTHLTFNIDGTTIQPDDFASGAVVYMKEADTATRTIVEMSLIKDKIDYLLFLQMDTLAESGMEYGYNAVHQAYISIDGKKYNVAIDNVKFTELLGTVNSNFTNLYYYENANGTFSGKFLKEGAVDSSKITGTFCYDDAPE